MMCVGVAFGACGSGLRFGAKGDKLIESGRERAARAGGQVNGWRRRQVGRPPYHLLRKAKVVFNRRAGILYCEIQSSLPLIKDSPRPRRGSAAIKTAAGDQAPSMRCGFCHTIKEVHAASRRNADVDSRVERESSALPPAVDQALDYLSGKMIAGVATGIRMCPI